MKNLFLSLIALWPLAAAAPSAMARSAADGNRPANADDGFVPLFNGTDLSGWKAINTAPSTWTVDQGMLICSGKPIGELRTERMYQNFVLELQWRHMVPGGNAGVFIWADDITAPGQPFHRGIEVQILENAYGDSDSHTCHGDIFPIHGATMTPVNGRGGSRAFPTELRSKPSPQWNDYRIECIDGNISLAVNGKVVTRGTDCNPRKGYICLESEGGVVHYRDIRIKELPDTPLPDDQVAQQDRGYRSLYNGLDLSGWHTPRTAQGHWLPSDWVLKYTGGSDPDAASGIETNESFGDFGFIVDVRWPEQPAPLRVYVRGQPQPAITIDPADPQWAERLSPAGRWTRIEAVVAGDALSVTANGKPPIQHRLPSDAAAGPLRLQPLGRTDLANIYVRALSPPAQNGGSDSNAASAPASAVDPAADAASQAITEAALRGHIRFLADDLLEGRGPGSRGDDLTRLYLSTQLQGMALQPAAPDGSWQQSVPLVGVQSTCPPTITFEGGSQPVQLQYYDDYIATIGQPQQQASVDDAEVVFVGYGIQAPEYQWNDFKDVDVRGKVLLIINNDPSDDPELFAGKRRLYYGRWDYKYAKAAEMGAAGAIIIHTTPSAGYPFQVVQTSWSGEEFELRDTAGPRMAMRGWVTSEAAERLASAAGRDLQQLIQAAQEPDFQPVPLGLRLSMQLQGKIRHVDTANVLAMLEGSDPNLKQQAVVFMAHHDHIGVAATRGETQDRIYNGAVDNASGTAALLAIARAFSEMDPPPRRSILFAAVGAEEQGLLGSKYLALHPPVPAGRMAAVINIDGLNIIGPTHDVNMIGMGKSSLDKWVQRAAAQQGRIVTPDHFPDRGYYYRSDQFSLAKIGVPGVYLHSGVNVIGQPEGWGEAKLNEWIEKTYHQPSDEYRADWDLRGALQDVRLLFQVGHSVANAEQMPTWNPGDEFEAARNAALQAVDAAPAAQR